MEKKDSDVKVYKSFDDFFKEKDKNNPISKTDRVCKNCVHYYHKKDEYPIGICLLHKHYNKTWRDYKVDNPYKKTCSKFQTPNEYRVSQLNINSPISIKNKKEDYKKENYYRLKEEQIDELTNDLYENTPRNVKIMNKNYFNQTETAGKLRKICTTQYANYCIEKMRIVHKYNELQKEKDKRNEIICGIIIWLIIIFMFILSLMNSYN